VHDTPFFLSAVFRRALDEILESYEPAFQQSKKNATVWRPRVVWTRLSKRYAEAFAGKVSDDELRVFLSARFAVDDVPTAGEFVHMMTESLSGAGDEP
jgi:hypothetical protein